MSERAKRLGGRWLAVPVILLALNLLFMPAATRWGQAVGLPLVGLITCWLIIAIQHGDFFRRVFSLAPAVYLGRISYGIYLWHYPILSIAASRQIPHAGMMTPFVTLVVAALCYRYVETPFLRFKDRGRPIAAHKAIRPMVGRAAAIEDSSGGH
ncbi:acyltransferase family protein [uncultured Sphingomonas sp.]|uniref:acyltransferase family protein n=1 Tax=uncultured Sphingomonas sp. TaxID=158754 RepID=UPI0035CC30F0